MTTYPMHYADNGHTWSRIVMLAKLYWPGLKIGFILCAAIPAVAVFISAGISHLANRPVDWIFQWPVGLLLYLSPIMLTKRDYRDASAQLPVTATEKLVFLLLTFFIAVPGVVYLSSLIGEWVSVGVFGDNFRDFLSLYQLEGMQTLREYGFNHEGMAKAMAIISLYAMIAIVLYYVVTAKKNRVMAAILSLLIVSIATGLFTGICGAVIGFIQGYQGAYDGASDQEITLAIAHSTVWIIMAVWMLMAIIGIVYLVKLYKRLRNCGF